ncbi:MAG: zinc ribbon domain-containing protein [Pyrinomonadaceae bacterium]|nr:zinc ribbon domain-containing protein [Pyrinomonadaceae bacterium]
MHCPKCGQQQISDETRYCSRCGFQMSGVLQLLRTDGQLPALTPSGEISPRRRGVYKGIFFFLLSFLVVPILTMITIFMRAEPFAVVAAAVLFSVGGLLRIAYAVMFESSIPGTKTFEDSVKDIALNLSGKKQENPALPPQQSMPVEAYTAPATGNWRDTNDLSRTPGSVTDSTTKLLHKENDQ